MTSAFPSLSTILSEPDVARLMAEPGPWWLWTADASRLVVANTTGARAMGASGLAAALDRDYPGTHAFAAQIGRLAPTLPADGTPRSERLRIAGRFGSESVVAEACRIRAGALSLIAVRLPSLRRETSREAALGFIATLRIPALAFDRAGVPLAASDAASALAATPLRDLVGPVAESIFDSVGDTGRAAVDLVNGPMTVVALPEAGLIVALLAPLAKSLPEAGLRLVAGGVDPAAAPDTDAAAEEASPIADLAAGEAVDDTAQAAPVAAPAMPLAEAEEIATLPAATKSEAPVPAPIAAMDPASSVRTVAGGHDEETVDGAQDAAPETVSREILAQTGPDQPASAAMPEVEPAETVVAVPAVPQRFSWRMDGDYRFHTIAPEEVAGLAGETLDAATARLGIDPSGVLTTAVTARRPFSGVAALWPLGRAGRRLAVTLAAFPALRDGAFQGYSGFGLVVEEASPVAPPSETETLSPDAPVSVTAAAETAVSAGEVPPANALNEAVATVDADPQDVSEPSDAVTTEDDSAVTAPIAAAAADDAIVAGEADDTAGATEAPAFARAEEAAALSGARAGEDADPVAADAEPLDRSEPADPSTADDDSAVTAPIAAATADDAIVAGEADDAAGAAEAPDLAGAEDDTALSGAPAEEDADPVAATVATLPDVTASEPTATGSGEELPEEAQSGDPTPDADATRPVAETRPVLTVHTNPPNVVALRTSVGQDSKRPQLSPGERNAFREIARALGARTSDPIPADEDGTRPPEAPPPPAEQAAPGAQLPPPVAPVATEPLDSRDSLPETRSPDTAGEAPARAFVDSGTPFGPLPSAFGADPAASGPDQGADLAALLDKVPTGLIIHRGNAVLFANRTLLDWVGFPDAAALEEAGGVSRLFAGGPDDGSESVSLTTVEGSALPVEAHLSRVTWAGQSAFLFTLTRAPAGDVASDHESTTLSELRGRLEEVEQILDTATDGIVIVTADGAIESMNRSAEALFGYESAEVKGMSVTTLFAPESHRSALDYCDGLLSNGVASVLNDGRQIIGRVKQGGLIPLYMTMGRTGPAARPKLAAVFRDMTHWKKAEEDLIAAKRQAEQASSQKSDFLAKISHEIRTPLNAIIGFSEVMMEERFGPVGNERYRDYLKDIHASGGHVLSLINDLLDLSKIEAGKLELAFTSVDLNDMVQSTVAIMQPQANRERVIIRSSLQPRLPNVVADSRSLRQIVLNLLSNSVKFTPAGGQIIVSTGLSEAGEAVLRVRDTGVGMTETELKAAMEPFRQVATSNPRAAKGTGLGLPLTKALVEANRASFGISSTPNQGTLVEVVFPPTRVLAE
ncbi:ATP-binding protein [Phreatobacter sp.]|uniref:PAS domain-containing sensor histidine kinase n=1 Tax=Phreatobacter sp. TaxID=1966341 RepID=UPI0025D336CE|nr:ATP-binding protein [Phreatobacter sp.]